MPKVISLINLKGGVAKTTTTVQLADCISLTKRRVLVIDLDPQANATESLIGRDKTLKITPEDDLGGSADNLNVSQCFFDHLEQTNHFDIHKVRLQRTSNLSDADGPDLIPSSLKLLEVQDRLSEIAEKTGYMISPVEVLKFAIQPIIHEYQFVLIDCPPSLNLLTRNALEISDFYLIPVINDPLSTRGLYQILKRVNDYSGIRNWKIQCLGVLITKYRARATATFQQERSKLERQVDTRCREIGIDTPPIFSAYMPQSEGVSGAMDFDSHPQKLTFSQKYSHQLGEPKQSLNKWIKEIVKELGSEIQKHDR